MKFQRGFRTTVASLKKEAKRWLKALDAKDIAALARFEKALPGHERDITLRTVQWALARERGFDGWQALIRSLDVADELRAVADEMLRHPIFKGNPGVATRLFLQHPEIASFDFFTAIATGDIGTVERQLAADPEAASRAGGPLAWAPLLYLAYMRLPGSASQSIDIAKALLDRGADPNARWSDNWGTPFTVLAGVIGLGEGVKPPHERADDLAELLLERGANPVDTQVFYDTSIVNDDPHWLEVLWRHSERRGLIHEWRSVPAQPLGGKIPLSHLDFMLGLATSYNHPRRAEWLLRHGAHADGVQAYSGRRLHDEALVHGHDEMVALLVAHGSSDAPLQDRAAFQVACRKLDRAEAQRLSKLHPEYLLEAETMLTAAREKRLDIVQLLLELGTPVDVEDQGGVRALNVAAGSGATDIVKLLIRHGADIDRPTKHYGGPMGFAAHFRQRATAELLAPRSRDVHRLVYLGFKDRLRELFAAEPQLVNIKDPRADITSLFTLPEDESAALDMAKFLLQHGADKSFRDETGATAAEVARKLGFKSLAELLS